jgi:hypothetical protein
MDDEEKVFPIEFVVILIAIALGNDIAEIFFDLLDFTGVGVAGEGIMEPINLLLDLFFTGVFVWKAGFAGPTITQYIDDLLEPLLIPGRTISVGVGIWMANHPKSIVSKVANDAAQLEGDIETGEGGAIGGVENAAGTAGAEAGAVQGTTLQGEGTNNATRETSEAKSNQKENSGRGSESSSENEGTENNEEQKTPEEDVMEDPNERDPEKNLKEQLLEPPKDDEFPKPAEEEQEPQEPESPRKVTDISAPRPNQSPKVVNIDDYRKQQPGTPQAKDKKIA